MKNAVVHSIDISAYFDMVIVSTEYNKTFAKI